MKVVPLVVTAFISILKKLWQIGKYVHMGLYFVQDHIYDVETKTLLIKIKSSHLKESIFINGLIYLLYSKFFSNSLNLFQTDISSTMVAQLLTKYCSEPSTLPNALVIC